MWTPRFVHSGDRRMQVVWPELLILSSALITGDVDRRESSLVDWDRIVVSSREPNRSQIKSVIVRIRDRRANESVVAVSQIQHRRRIDRPNFIDSPLPRSEIKELTGSKIVEV